MKNQWKINRETPSKKFYPGMGLENAMQEYRKKADEGVRWGCEFVILKNKNNEIAPIILMGAKYFIIERDGRLHCVGNRVPSRPYVAKKYEHLLTPEQLKTLKSILDR
ncbi:hypothetical protein [Fluviispira sanaruensis]|uniref:Uncharacterized protein n=1 Tax=Fluviispira sanaruensis TaxID=2493639 RepID=A0A4V0P2X6_FLUSA|nr:hypothetical protein [Fluviispira sanaruensis]BBH54757.1 hypothetical protein JCM31447_32310 [Fluviispira sanaruensis]